MQPCSKISDTRFQIPDRILGAFRQNEHAVFCTVAAECNEITLPSSNTTNDYDVPCSKSVHKINDVLVNIDADIEL
jgi:hypothetical protein